MDISVLRNSILLKGFDDSEISELLKAFNAHILFLVCQKNQIYGQQQQGRRNFAEWRDKNEKDNKKNCDRFKAYQFWGF